MLQNSIVIRESVDSEGYDVEWLLVNGVQRRLRIKPYTGRKAPLVEYFWSIWFEPLKLHIPVTRAQITNLK